MDVKWYTALHVDSTECPSGDSINAVYDPSSSLKLRSVTRLQSEQKMHANPRDNASGQHVPSFPFD